MRSKRSRAWRRRKEQRGAVDQVTRKLMGRPTWSGAADELAEVTYKYMADSMSEAIFKDPPLLTGLRDKDE